MKIRMLMKDPDTMPDAVDDAFKAIEKPEGVSAEEWADIREERAQLAKSFISDHWMEFGEYLAVEFDTEAKTATILPRGSIR